MEPATREDVAALRSSLETLTREVSELAGAVREEIGRSSTQWPIVSRLQHYVEVDCGIRDNGSAGSLDTVVRSHEAILQTARRGVRWAMGSMVAWAGTAAYGLLFWLWQRFPLF